MLKAKNELAAVRQRAKSVFIQSDPARKCSKAACAGTWSGHRPDQVSDDENVFSSRLFVDLNEKGQ